MSENKETREILYISDNIIRGDFDLFDIVDKCARIYDWTFSEFVYQFVHSFTVPGVQIGANVEPNYDINYIPYIYYHDVKYVSTVHMLKMIYGAIVFDKVYPFFRNNNIDTLRDTAKILTNRENLCNDEIMNNITKISGTSDDLVSRLCAFVYKYGGYERKKLKFNMIHVDRIHEFKQFLLMNKIIKDPLTPAELENAVMCYFKMKEMDELAALLRLMMKNIKSEYEAKVNSMKMFLNLNGEFMDTNKLHGRDDELNQLMKKYEFIERLHDSLNARIEHPDALP